MEREYGEISGEVSNADGPLERVPSWDQWSTGAHANWPVTQHHCESQMLAKDWSR